MTYKNIVAALLASAMLTLSACSSAVGDSPTPHNTTVVVPPANSTTTTY